MPEVSRDDLRRAAVFHDLPDEQLDWFLDHATELRLQPGEVGTRAGDPADKMVVILEGQMQGRIEGTNENVFTANAGSVTGMLPYSRMTIFPATTRAVLPSRILVFPSALFDDLLSHMPELARRLVAPWLTAPVKRREPSSNATDWPRSVSCRPVWRTS